MRAAGIICEYNPFHLGHEKQLRLVRERVGEDTAAVCLMSGNFVQRGAPALFDQDRPRAGGGRVRREPCLGAAGHCRAFLGGGLCARRRGDP